MKGIGIGESDFKGLIIRNDYFIDKTMYIKEIMDNKSRVILVTRPRRFGKTLNMSMLRYYFDCTKKDTKELFNGLKIMEQEEKYTSKQGYYPCIYMTLKDVRGSDYEEMMMCFRTELNELFIDHANLLQSEKLLDVEKEMFSTVLNLKANKVEMQNAYVEGFYDETIKFFKTFYGTTFKDNSYLEKTVITGVY
ncbi:MAG: AAA family ATPase [Clostridia bacterium]|nr:AAA family ATPase [Clostridia bacterium]